VGSIGLVWGILAIAGMFVAFFPCLGSLNWLNIPFALLGGIVAAIGTSVDAEGRWKATVGVALCLAAVLFGLLRLLLGGGLL